MSRSRWAAVLATVFALALGAAPAAQAITITTSTVNITASAPILGDLTNGLQTLVSGLVGATTQAACQLSGNNSTVCTLNILSYGVATDYKLPNGTHVTKVTGGVINLPTLVDATGDGLPDVSVLIQAVSTGNIKMTIQKLITAPANFPVSVEALVNDPSTANRIINVGYDTRATTAPATWNAQASLSTGTSTTVNATLNVTTPPSSMAVIGGLFTEGPSGARLNPKQARLTFTPVPAQSALSFTLAPASTTGTVSSHAYTKADLELLMLDGTSGSHVLATLNQLSNPVTVLLNKVDANGVQTDGTTGNTHVRLNTNKDVNHADFIYEAITNSQVLTRVHMATGLLPGQTDFTQTPSGVLVDTSDPLDIGGGVSTGVAAVGNTPAIPVPANFPVESNEASYVHEDTTNQVDSTTFRVAGLRHVAVDTTGPQTNRKIAIDARLTSAPLHALITNDAAPGGTKYDANVNSLPHNFSLAIALGQTRIVDFCGSSTDVADPCSAAAQASPVGIGNIVLNPSYSPTPLFGKATHLNGTITGIPSTLGIDVQTHAPVDKNDPNQNTRVYIDATRPIGNTILRATDGTAPPADPVDNGLVYFDTPGQYAVIAKVDGFLRAHLDTDPKLALELNAAGGHNFSYDINTPVPPPPATPNAPATQRHIYGSMPNRPADTQVTLASPTGAPTVLTVSGFDSSSNPVSTPRLLLHMTQAAPIFGKATQMDADVTDMPTPLALTIDTHSPTGPSDPNQNTKVHIDSTQRIGNVLLHANDGQPSPAAPVDNGLTYIDNASQFAVVAKVDGFTYAHLDTSPKLDLDFKADSGHDFKYLINMTDRQVNGTLANRPARTHVTLASPTGQPTVLTVDGEDALGADAVTPSMTLNLDQTTAIFDRATHLDANVTNIPANYSLTIATRKPADKNDPDQNTQIHIDGNQRIGHALIRATDGSPAGVSPLDNGIVYTDAPSKYEMIAKVDGFLNADVDTKPGLDVDLNTDGGHTFTFDLDMPGTVIDGTLANRPAVTHVTFGGTPTKLTVSGHTVGGVAVGHPGVLLDMATTPDAPIFPKADHVHVDVAGIPALWNMIIDTHTPTDASDPDQNTKVHIDASAPVDVLFRAWGGTDPIPADPVDNGVVYQDQSGKPFAIIAKVNGFENAHLDTKPQLEVHLNAASGHNFTYEIHLPASGGKPESDFTGLLKNRPKTTHFFFDNEDGKPMELNVTNFDDNGIATGIDEITLDAQHLSADPADVLHNVKIDLVGVPKVLDLTKQPGDSTDIAVTTTGGPVAMADAVLSNDNPPDSLNKPTIAANGGGVIVFTSPDSVAVADKVFYIHAHVLQLKSVHFVKGANLEADIDVGTPQNFQVYIDQGVGLNYQNPDNVACKDDFDADHHTKAHLEYHNVFIRNMQPNTKFSYTSGDDHNSDPCKVKSWRKISYSADARADSITYDSTAGDQAHLHTVIGEDGSNPLQVPKRLDICQSGNDFCYQQIGKTISCNGLNCDSSDADTTVTLGATEKTHVALNFCSLNDDANNFSDCVRETARNGIFVKLNFKWVDMGYAYDTGDGFFSMNTRDGAGLHQANGFIRTVNDDSAARFINLNFGYDASTGPDWQATSSSWDQYVSQIVLAVAGGSDGTANCINESSGPSYDDTNDYFHAVIDPANILSEDDLGDMLSAILC